MSTRTRSSRRSARARGRAVAGSPSPPRRGARSDEPTTRLRGAAAASDGARHVSAGPAVRDREPAVLTERLGRDAYTGRRLPPLVLVAIDHANDALHELRVVAAGDELAH